MLMKNITNISKKYIIFNMKDNIVEVGSKVTKLIAQKNKIQCVTLDKYKEIESNEENKHNVFLNKDEWRKQCKWNYKKVLYAVETSETQDGNVIYEIKEIKEFMNTLPSILHVQENLDALFKYHNEINNWRYNEFTKKNEFFEKEYDEDKQPAEIFNFFKRNFGEWCPRQDIKETIQEILNNNEYHPIKNWLNNITWDGEDRLETFLIKYYGAKDTKLNRTYFKRWMIALIKRIFNPGAKFDSMLILAGEKGKKKSSLLYWLGTINGIKYYNEVPDNLKDLNNLIYATKGKMIMTFDDFDDICNKGDIGKIKSFITEQARTAALKWQHEKNFEITYVLGATTNQYNMLVDDAAFDERRFWIVKVHPDSEIFDIPDSIKEQLYAEAYYLYRLDPEQKLWIWEPELKQEEIELQKKYKKASEDPIVEKVTKIFINKYYLPNGNFLNENQFVNAVNGREYEECDGNNFINKEEDYNYITIIPASWINSVLTEKRSTDRIIQILHTQGFEVKKLSRYRYDGKIQLTCIQILNQPEYIDE